MIRRRLGWLLLFAVSILWGLALGSAVALAMAALLLLLPLLLLPLSFYVRKRLQLSLEAPGSLRKGSEGQLRVLLENSSLLPVFCVRCRIHAENQLNGECADRELYTWLAPRRLRQAALNFESEYCGRLRLTLRDVTLYDCFGLLGVRLKSDAHRNVAVQPDTFDMALSLRPSSAESDDSEAYSPYRTGTDLTEIFQIREYAEGDSPRQIHWKLSGKLDKLIVKDPSLPIMRSIMVFWERTGDSGHKGRIDAQAEVLVSLCRTLLEESMQFVLAWNDTERHTLVTHEIRDMDELIGVIPRLLCARGEKEGLSGAELLWQSGHKLPARVIYLAEEPQSSIVEIRAVSVLTPLLCGAGSTEGALHFDETLYSQQLAKIEI